MLRHAATQWNDDGRRQGWVDQPLTLEGRRAARAWTRGRHGEFAGVVASDLKRARQTAQIIAGELGLGDVAEFIGLREQDQGAWTGLTKEQIKRRWPERLRERPRRPVDGELHEVVLTRVLAALSSLAQTHEGQSVLAVTHSGVIRTLERALGALAPPVPHLEGRWFRLVTPGVRDASSPVNAVRVGDLTARRRTLAGDSDHERSIAERR